jgi:hypothetical protein
LALVVGDSGDAVWGRLENAKNDAELIARTLKTLGFDLITGGAVIDPDRRHLQQAIVDFGHSIGSQTVALFYFAGHGIQSGGHNYLVPLGAPFPRSEDEYEKNLVEVDDPVLSKMQQAGGRLNIVVLDACRDHPPLPAFMTASRGGSQFAQGLTAVTPPPGMNGTVILYSTAPNNIALDRVNPGDADSPFAAAFATAVVRPGADLRDAFDEIQDAVKSATRGRQQPWISYSAVGKFSFSDRPGVQEASSRIPMPTLPTPVEDPRKELAGLGVTWTPANFHSAIREKDYRAVELFLRGGMKMDIRGAGYTEFSLFVEMNYDQKIAEMIEKYGAPDPDRLCPVPLQYYRSYHFYTDTAMQSPASAQFMKKICNAPSVITNIDAGIAKLQTTAAEDRKARDAAKKAPPPNAWQREVSEGMASVMPSMRPASVGYRWEISPVTHDWHEVEDAENEAIGWQAARDFLTRGVVPPKMLPLPRR